MRETTRPEFLPEQSNDFNVLDRDLAIISSGIVVGIMCERISEMENKQSLEIFRADVSSSLELPYANFGIQAGFPSPAQDYIDEALDLNKITVKNPLTTFFARVRGDSLIEDDINEGDLLVIDKSLDAKDGDLVVAAIDGEFTLKYLEVRQDGVWLMPANENYKPIPLDEDDPFMIFGVVTWYLKKPRHKKCSR